MTHCIVLYCIVLYLQPVLNPKSYDRDGARVLEAGCDACISYLSGVNPLYKPPIYALMYSLSRKLLF